MRRFYKAVSVTVEEGGHQVRLDGKPLRTPARAVLALPNADLAAAVAAEWDAQGQTVRPATMLLTQMAATTIDRIQPDPAAMADEIVRFAETDLVCYRATDPPALVERQQATWQPLVDWATLSHDAALRVVHGVMPAPQPPAALAALRSAVGRLDPWRLAVLAVATPAAGSAVIALALVAGRIDAEAAWDASQLDETFQIERWGEDAEAAARREALRHEFAAAERFLRLLAT